ncbi:ABC transporter ATP-binding protein [Motiliproteus sp. MSK22-1]|uniref:ABC transporter transmembrane domain-containing protein n=1 Tax=Motiliproteus sp. MSK22-1 TaxID=1897630 RepID=UPI000975991A|nr:ABC transporter ATP-binding protein [Motiliproteus sp. MSK22-1]OMH39745.1 hypothetical protein BGP75_01410 [Motiliproteus sp. MSK22-1]
MESSIFRYILRYTLKDQILILILTVLSLPFLYATLEVPKLIINDAIGGANVPDNLFGYPVDQLTYLLVLCLTFLVLVIVNGGMKYVLNVYRGVVGERMLRRLRFDLFSRILRFPVPHFKKVSQGEVIPIITAETEPLGGFIGEAFALPAFQGGILLTYLFFIFNQDVLLGIVATALYPFQLYIIPKLQRKVNALGKERVLAARKLGDRIGDSISGIQEVHANDTSHFERAVISQRLGLIYKIRFEIYKKKFFIKFLNNFLAQVTPFFFYLFGGYYIIQGELSLGALVAVLAAYKDLSSPWKELLKFYQTKEDVRIKYEQIIDQFQPQSMLDTKLQESPPLELDANRGGWEGTNVYYEEQGIGQVDRLSFKLDLNTHSAIVGIGSSGKEELGQLLARLITPTQGRLSLAGMDMRNLPESVIGKYVAYVGANAHHFSGSIRDNLIYSLRHRPIEERDSPERQQEISSAKLSGNSIDDPDANWVDEEALDLAAEQTLTAHIHRVLAQSDLNNDLFQLGLLGTLADHHQQQHLEEQVLKAREMIHKQLQEGAYKGLVELFDWNKYNTNLTVLENILFSPGKRTGFDRNKLAGNEQLQAFLDKQGLLEDFLVIGREITEIMVDLFSDIDENSDLFERFSFISADELPAYAELLKQTKDRKIGKEEKEICEKLLSLTFQLSTARHRLGLIDEILQKRILQARSALVEEIASSDLKLEFFDSYRYNSDLNLQDNMLFGKMVYGQARAEEKVTALIHQVVTELGLEEGIIEVGLDYDVGTSGMRLSSVQRQKLAIARALVKKPEVLILNEATSGFDPAAETRMLVSLRDALEGRGLVYITSRAVQAKNFDNIIVLEKGRLMEQGTYEHLSQNGKVLPQMLG